MTRHGPVLQCDEHGHAPTCPDGMAERIDVLARMLRVYPAADRSASLLSGLDLRCECYMGPDHRPTFDACSRNGRTRGGAGTADQWCLPCEVRDRLGLSRPDPGTTDPLEAARARTPAADGCSARRPAGDHARAVLARRDRLVRRWLDRTGERWAEALRRGR